MLPRWMMVPRWMLPILIVGILVLSLPATTPRAHGDEIDVLIEQLGDESYIVRSSAANRLQRIGLKAFDRLYQSQFRSEIEIAMTSRRLISNLMVNWSLPSDSKDVREALDQYGRQSDADRKNRIELLAGLPDRGGTVALARLVRYEMSGRLSAAAAMAILQQYPREDLKRRAELAAEIQRIMGDADRVAATWMIVYADDLIGNRFDQNSWQRFIANHRQRVDLAATDQASRASVLEMIQTVAVHAGRMNDKPAAIELVMANLDLITPKTAALSDMATWAIDHELFVIVDKLRERFEPLFSGNAMLSYAAAEAAIRQGDEPTGRTLADQASKMPEIPGPDQIDALQPRELQVLLMRHSVTAARLVSRGLYHWALREYQSVIDAVPIDNSTSVNCRLEAANLLSELGRHADVIELLEPLVDRVEKDRDMRRITPLMRQDQAISGMLLYHQAELSIEQGNIAEACEKLQKAYDIDQNNIDVLIRMYRLEHDQAWRETVLRQVNTKIREYEILIAQTAGRGNFLMGRAGLEPADAYNNYAWLVSNTEGNFERALKLSLRSIEQTEPGDTQAAAARMDTCARCYFALGQIDQAIAMQRRAIMRMPHSPPLQQQLDVFKKARDESPSR